MYVEIRNEQGQEGKFYTYHQNNSGGEDVIQDGQRPIARIMVIEAVNEEDANRRAEMAGLYFDGVSGGGDCACCGDRWSRQWDEDGHPEPTLDGQPLIQALEGYDCHHKAGELGAVVVHMNGQLDLWRAGSDA